MNSNAAKIAKIKMPILRTAHQKENGWVLYKITSLKYSCIITGLLRQRKGINGNKWYQSAAWHMFKGNKIYHKKLLMNESVMLINHLTLNI